MTQKKPKPMGRIQLNWLRCIKEHGGHWHPGCGYYWKNRSTSINLCDSLVKRGYLTKSNDRASYDITPSGRLESPQTFKEFIADEVKKVNMPTKKSITNEEASTLPGYLSRDDPRRRCVGCGKVMNPTYGFVDVLGPGERCIRRHTTWQQAVRVDWYGVDKKGYFCTLTCGYMYACKYLSNSIAHKAYLEKQNADQPDRRPAKATAGSDTKLN